jgi:sugar phosphate isomerase/epimerase
MPPDHSVTPRRHFLKTVAGAASSQALNVSAQPSPQHKIPERLLLGMDNFAVRAMGWKAERLLDYAAEQRLDTLLISDLDAYSSLDDGYLRELKAKANQLQVQIYAGSWSICPSSTRFKNQWGNAEEHLRTGIRVAKTLGSPVFRVILGSADDRKTLGGIQARIADTIAVLQRCEKDSRNAGVRIAVENHAGDLHSWELRDLIEKAGPEFVGANIDSGNSTWTLEDPMDVLERLGPYIVCSSLRDNMIWETEEGAAIAWTAAGEGLMDWKAYTARWQQLCPHVPIHIETISGFSRTFPYRTPPFWIHYERHPEALEHFESMARRGHPIPEFKPPEGPEKKLAEQAFQKGELERSIHYLRTVVGLGRKV